MHLTLQRKTELALRALRVLAEGQESTPGADLASRLEATPSYLPQVMAPLVAAGWVTSGRGPGGGYRLQRSARDVSVLALVEASEGPVRSDRCVLRPGSCGSDRQCAMHDAWQRAQGALMQELDSIPVLPARTNRG